MFNSNQKYNLGFNIGLLSSKYSFANLKGFNGMESDDEVKGTKNSYTTQFRQYDPRVGRWLSIDPKQSAWESPYVSMANNPVFYSDPNGDTIVIVLVNKKDDPGIYQVATEDLVKEQVDDGVFIVVAHMDPLRVQHDVTETNDTRKFYDNQTLLIALGGISPEFDDAYKNNKVKSLILAGCNSASDPQTYYNDDEFFEGMVSLAEYISSVEKTWDVIGTTGYIGFEPGKGVSGISSKYVEDRKNNNDGYKDKDFVTYRAGENVTENERGKDVKVRAPHSGKLERTTNNNGIKPKHNPDF